jgi:hypothetical protein
VLEAYAIADACGAGVRVAMGGLHVSVPPTGGPARRLRPVRGREAAWAAVVELRRRRAPRVFDAKDFAAVDVAAARPRYDPLGGRPYNGSPCRPRAAARGGAISVRRR